MSRQVDLIERIADLLRDEFYETLEDAAGAGESYDYEAFATRIAALLDPAAHPRKQSGT